MVTTRSADKRLKQDGEKDILASSSSVTDTLALRSKLDANGSLTEPSDIEASPLASISKRRKALLDDPPGKRTRRSYHMDHDDDINAESPITDQPVPETALAANNKAYDDQGPPPEARSAEDFQPQPDLVALNEHDPSSSVLSTTIQARKAADIIDPNEVPTTAPIPELTTKGKHKRFDNEEVSEDHDATQVEMNHDTIGGSTESPISDDDDDAPEVATIRNIPSRSLLSKKKKPRLRKAEPESKIDTATSQTNADESTETNNLKDDLRSSKLQPTPSLTVVTKQDPVLGITNASQESEDSVFTTASSSHHVDIFSTPMSGTPQLDSHNPDLDLKDTIQTPKQFISTSNDTNLASQTSKPSRHVSQSVRMQIASQTLPRKVGKSLEMRRRQMLQNRAEKGAKNARGGQFKLQSEWSGKNKRFVIGYR